MSAELIDLSNGLTYPLDVTREDLLPKLKVGGNLSIPSGSQFFVLYGLRGYLLSRRIVILTDVHGKRWKIKFGMKVRSAADRQ